jgi:hypothetical protein
VTGKLAPTTPRPAIKKRREASSHLFVQIGTIIAGISRNFNTQINDFRQGNVQIA